jgi:hypothetical protein
VGGWRLLGVQLGGHAAGWRMPGLGAWYECRLGSATPGLGLVGAPPFKAKLKGTRLDWGQKMEPGILRSELAL